MAGQSRLVQLDGKKTTELTKSDRKDLFIVVLVSESVTCSVTAFVFVPRRLKVDSSLAV